MPHIGQPWCVGAGVVRPTSVVVTIGPCTVHHNTAPSLLTHSFTRVSFFHTCQWQYGIAQMISIKHLSQTVAINYGGVLDILYNVLLTDDVARSK